MDISVIIPTFNQCQLLEYTLSSLSEQSMPRSRFEVIISDDGSSDNTAHVAKRYRDQINLKYLFHEDVGHTPSRARNDAIAVASGDLCVFLDDTLIVSHHCLQEYWQQYQREPSCAQIGYVFGYRMLDKDIPTLKQMVAEVGAPHIVSTLRKQKMFLDVRSEIYAQHPDIDKLLAPWVIFLTCNVAVSREKLYAVGLFDEAFSGWGFEDLELGYRLRQHGTPFHLNRKADCLHYPHGVTDPAKKYKGREGLRYFCNKFPVPEVLRLLRIYTDDIFPDGLQSEYGGNPRTVCQPYFVKDIRPGDNFRHLAKLNEIAV